VGVDGGGLDDLLGLCVIGRERDTGAAGVGRAWAHEIVLERRKEIAEQLRDLATAGEIVLVGARGRRRAARRHREQVH
jgi:phage terminase large subunit-like protein